MSPQGPRLRTYFKLHGIKLVAAATKLGIHVNTLQNWLSSSELELKAFARLAEHWPDVMDEFPEVEWRKVPSNVMEPNVHYLSKADSACLEKLTEINQRYIALLERHNALLEKYLALKERVSE
jgi:hypothetical protein